MAHQHYPGGCMSLRSIIASASLRVVCSILLLALVPAWLRADQVLAQPAAGSSQSVVPGQTPDGLDPAAWADIQAQIAPQAYPHPFAQQALLQAPIDDQDVADRSGW